jgi:DNA annealing helicase and endonuclease ZRANB3
MTPLSDVLKVLSANVDLLVRPGPPPKLTMPVVIHSPIQTVEEAVATEFTDVEETLEQAAEAALTIQYDYVSLHGNVERKFKPRKYQIEGIKRLVEKKRALLYDLAGLGKTLQASEAAELPCLVACPTYLTFQWYVFLREQYPENKVLLVEGTRPQREKLLEQKADWYIVNIEMFAPRKNRNQDAYLEYRFPEVKTLIVDESHHVRGRDAAQSKGVFRYAQNCERVYLLTATPQYKGPDDLYMQLRILDRKSFPSYYDFVSSFCRVSANGFGSKIIGVKSHQAIRDLLSNNGIGRTYEDVKVELPELIRHNIPIKPTEEFMQMYDRVRFQFTYNEKDINSLMEAMHIMRRMTAQVKLERVLEILLETGEEPEGIIFTYYKDTAKAIGALLDIPCITGEMEAKERKELAQMSRLTVATISAMSEGVDLSHVSHVIFMESDYVPGKIYQALSRVRRMRTNQAPVRASFVYVKDTIDEIVHDAAGRRYADIRQVMRAALLGD